MTMAAEALAGLIFVPLLAGMAALVLPHRFAGTLVIASLALLPVLLWPVTLAVWNDGVLLVPLAGVAPPLGIVWRGDPLSLTMLWLTAVVALFVSLHALEGFRPGSGQGRHFWPLWPMLVAALNAVFLSADLFNLYVTLELVTLGAVILIGIGGRSVAMIAAMRYLLLALMASLFYLLATALIYGQTGTLDLYLAGERLQDGTIAIVALTLMITGLLLKSAIFPLHMWLPAAHGNAPWSVSAVLSALVVKASLYIVLRVWFWTGAGLDTGAAAMLLGLLGAAAILYGSLAALVQQRLKMLIAYSTVAQLGYVMLLFPLASTAAFRGVTLHLLAHGFAKAAMFLAAANILRTLGHDRLWRMTGIDRKLPVDLVAFALAGVSLMGLPPSGGFLAKWLLLQAAWGHGGWGWMAVIVVGSLLAAAYVFRVAALTMFGSGRAGAFDTPGRLASLAAVALALLAIALGVFAAPVLSLIDLGLPPGMTP
jgi:multicomponent Na+:H+ antiporter subunit D